LFLQSNDASTSGETKDDVDLERGLSSNSNKRSGRKSWRKNDKRRGASDKADSPAATVVDLGKMNPNKRFTKIPITLDSGDDEEVCTTFFCRLLKIF